MSQHPILAACVLCIVLFALSHLYWWWREKSTNRNVTPVFVGRLIAILASLLAISRFTQWDMQQFTLWIIVFYLLLLIAHTGYLYHLFSKRIRQRQRKL